MEARQEKCKLKKGSTTIKRLWAHCVSCNALESNCYHFAKIISNICLKCRPGINFANKCVCYQYDPLILLLLCYGQIEELDWNMQSFLNAFFKIFYDFENCATLAIQMGNCINITLVVNAVKTMVESCALNGRSNKMWGLKNVRFSSTI